MVSRFLWRETSPNDAWTRENYCKYMEAMFMQAHRKNWHYETYGADKICHYSVHNFCLPISFLKILRIKIKGKKVKGKVVPVL
jgi:hypothetical protein